MLEAGEKYPCNIRLDSGDMEALSNQSRQLFKEIDLIYKAKGTNLVESLICASNGINEPFLEQISHEEHNINIFGIGTNLITCQKQPALGMVCKLTEFRGEGILKFSDEVAKSTLSYRKNVFWLETTWGSELGIICKDDEWLESGQEVPVCEMVKDLDIDVEELFRETPTIKCKTVTHLNPLVWDSDTDKDFDNCDYLKMKDYVDASRKKYHKVAMGTEDAHRVVYSPGYLRRFVEDCKKLKNSINKN